MQAIRDIMSTEVITLDPDMTLREAAAVLADHRVTGAPVMAGGRILGVLSASDILRVEAESSADDAYDSRDDHEPDEDASRDGTASPPPFFARLWPDAAVDVGARFGSGSGIDRPSGASPLDRRTVFEEMTGRVLDIDPGATIAQAAEQMAVQGVHRLLVVEGGRLAGIITTTDIAGSLIGALGARRSGRSSFAPAERSTRAGT